MRWFRRDVELPQGYTVEIEPVTLGPSIGLYNMSRARYSATLRHQEGNIYRAVASMYLSRLDDREVARVMARLVDAARKHRVTRTQELKYLGTYPPKTIKEVSR